MIGSLIGGKYRIVGRVGAGGMGTVYRAEHEATGKTVAVKILGSEFGEQSADGSEASESMRDQRERIIARFEREARAAGSIDSDHVVQIFDAGRDPEQDQPYMVMELLRGEDLRDACGRLGALEPGVALKIVAQACEGVAVAHDAGIVHRDIKLGNLLLAERGDQVVVKVLDFGIAKIRQHHFQGSHQGDLTQTGSLLGSPRYMAPEQAMGLKTVDHRADIWSLGVVLYRCLSGRMPFEDPTLGQLIVAICSAKPQPLQDVAPWLPDSVTAIVNQALGSHPEDRFKSARSMQRALHGLLGDDHSIAADELVSASDAVSTSLVETVGAAELELFESEPPPSTLIDSKSESTLSRRQAEDATEITRLAVAADDVPQPSGRGRLVGGVAAFALVALGGWVATRVMLPAGDGSAVAASTATTVPSGDPSSTASAGAGAERAVEATVTIEPAEAKVTIDGASGDVENGQVTIRGSLGSVHKVRIEHAEREKTVDVVLTERGALPAVVALTKGPRPSLAVRSPRAAAKTAHPEAPPPPAAGPARTPPPPPARPAPAPAAAKRPPSSVGVTEAFE